MLSTTTTPPNPTSSTQAANKTSPPIVLKISTRKLEIVSAIKAQIVENELCSTLFIYLIIVCFEINDWVNLKALLSSIKYPNNNINLFEKWFMYQFFNLITEKTIVEQFKHDWFVSLIFDDFLFAIVKLKDEQLQVAHASGTILPTNMLTSNTLYEQIYKLIEKLYPTFLSSINFIRLIEFVKPKKFVINFSNNYFFCY